MRKALAIAAVASLAIVPAAGAGATKGPTLRSLQTQITSLKKQVNTLKKRTTLAENIAIVALAYGGCSTAVTADTIQDVFVGVDGHFTHTGGATSYFGAQSALNDYGACQALEITRAHNQNPPTTAVLAALLDLFKPASTSATSFMSVPRSTGFVFSQLFVMR